MGIMKALFLRAAFLYVISERYAAKSGLNSMKSWN